MLDPDPRCDRDRSAAPTAAPPTAATAAAAAAVASIAAMAAMVVASTMRLRDPAAATAHTPVQPVGPPALPFGLPPLDLGFGMRPDMGRRQLPERIGVEVDEASGVAPIVGDRRRQWFGHVVDEAAGDLAAERGVVVREGDEDVPQLVDRPLHRKRAVGIEGAEDEISTQLALEVAGEVFGYLLLLAVALDHMVEGEVEGLADDLFFVGVVPTVTRELLGHGRHESQHVVTSFVVAPMKYYSTKPSEIHVLRNPNPKKPSDHLKNDRGTRKQPVDIT
jgi:hypothetical protein